MTCHEQKNLSIIEKIKILICFGKMLQSSQFKIFEYPAFSWRENVKTNTAIRKIQNS